jgi:hypothetical protein
MYKINKEEFTTLIDGALDINQELMMTNAFSGYEYTYTFEKGDDRYVITEFTDSSKNDAIYGIVKLNKIWDN